MESKVWFPDPPLRPILLAQGYRFDFFQAVRLLERMCPSRKPVGGTASPSEEIVRFAARLSLVFPASEIYEIAEESKDPKTGQLSPLHMTVSFMGLTGPLGVLPRHYTEFLIQRAAQKDHAAREFFDLFTHRLVSFFYRAWEKYRCSIAFERATRQRTQVDLFTEVLYALAGLGSVELRRRVPSEGKPLLFYAGLLAQRPHSAASLAGILRDHLGVPVTIIQFVGRWMQLRKDDWTGLGSHDSDKNNRLGATAMLGQTVWETQSKFKVRIGPLTFQQYRQFLPGGSALEAARAMTRFMASPELEFEIQLSLSAVAVPACRLETEGEGRTQLGWSTWLGSSTRYQDAEDLVLAA
jgi:type VI secretion system protein ImpH